MSNIKKGIKALIFVLILFMSMNNIKAIGTDMENDLKYIPNMEVEKLIDDHNIILPTKPTRAASGSVVEKIIKNSSGIMTGKEFRVDGKLVEAVYYNYLGNNAYQLCKRNLYHSDGKTIERTRLYNKSEWITNTKRYTEKGIIDWTTDYDGTSNKYPTVSSKYEETGKFWIYTNYYNKGILTSKDYRPGLAPNHISHTGFYEVTGTNWTKTQYYYTNANPTDKSKMDLVILYLGHASPNNFKTYETKYRNDGTRDYYIRYEEKNNNRDYLTYYNTAGKVIKTVSYYKGNSNREWETIYNDKDTKASAKKYSNTSGKLIDDVVFQDNGIVDHRTYYNDEGIKTRTLSHYKNSNSVEWETFYKEDGFKEKANRYSNGTNKLIDEIIFQDNNKVDVRTYFSEDSKTLRKIRYFKDGDHLRWDINYENGLKKNVHLYSKNNYALLENFYYTKEILELEDEIFKQMELDDYVTVWSNVINDSTFLGYMLDEIDLDVDDLFYYEDILHIKNIVINDSSNLYHNLNHKINDFDIENLEYIEKSNNIENLSGIEYIVRLEDIVVNNSEITELPDNISNLKRLRKIVIVNGSLSELPTSITKLKDLNEVNLSGNKLSAIDNNLLNLENIKSIDFSAIAIVNIGDGILSSHVEKINISPEMLNLDKTTRENISDYINSGKLKKSNNIILNYIDTHEIEKFKLEEYDLKNDISEYINGNKTKIKAEFLKQSDNTQSKFDYSEDDFKSIDIDDISNALVEEQGIYILKLSYDIHNYTFTSIFKIIIHNEIVEEYNLLISEPEDVEDNSANTRGEFDFRCNGSKKIKTISFSKVVPHSGYMGTFKKGIGSYFFSNNRNVNVPFSISFGVNYGFFSISATANFKNSGDRDGFGLTTNKKKYSRAVWNVKGNATLYKRYGGIFCNSKYTKYKINFIEPFIQYK